MVEYCFKQMKGRYQLEKELLLLAHGNPDLASGGGLFRDEDGSYIIGLITA